MNLSLEYGLKRVKMCELINCLINMTYTTRNNVGTEWDRWLQTLKTHLFTEISKMLQFSITVEFPIVNDACCAFSHDRG